MKFSVPVKEGWSTMYYQVELISNDGSFQRWRAARDKEFVIIQSNRPMLRAKGLKFKRPDWKVVDGNIQYANVVDQIAAGIFLKAHNPT